MGTFLFKNKSANYTPVSNIFIDKYMPKARGEFVKVYLLGLKYCVSGELGVSSSIMASALHLLETDVLNAWSYWNNEGIIKMNPVDNMGNFSIEFLDLSNSPSSNEDGIDLLKELDNSSTKDMLLDIEKLIGRPLSTKEVTMYISWIKDFNFEPEIILLLIQYCISKGKTDYRYIESIAISWHDSNIRTIEEAQNFIRQHEDKWINIRKILKYIGIKDGEVMKPQEEMLTKWLNIYNFPLEVIFKACDICFHRINKADFKYIDGILNSWHKDGIKTLNDVLIKDKKKPMKKNNNFKTKIDNFNNYEQRDYDFDALEKKLLGWDNK